MFLRSLFCLSPGEFNIWDTERHQLEEEERGLHSVTALKVDSKGRDMYTGNTLGYIQVHTEETRYKGHRKLKLIRGRSKVGVVFFEPLATRRDTQLAIT